MLAQLLRCDYLPAVWHPDEHTQKLRRLTTVRAGLVGDRTRLKNRVQCLLAQLLIEPPVNVLFTKQGLEWLRVVKLPPDDRETNGQLCNMGAGNHSPQVVVDSGVQSYTFTKSGDLLVLETGGRLCNMGAGKNTSGIHPLRSSGLT